MQALLEPPFSKTSPIRGFSEARAHKHQAVVFAACMGAAGRADHPWHAIEGEGVDFMAPVLAHNVGKVRAGTGALLEVRLPSRSLVATCWSQACPAEGRPRHL